MWITGDVEIPQEVVDAHADGDIVFFIGAGASMGEPSKLPSFKRLAEIMADKADIPFSDARGLDYFLGTLPKDFDTHRHVRDEIARPTSTFNSTHSAVVQLAASSGAFRVVTTNFDMHIEAAAAAHDAITVPDVWYGPALPLGSDYTGLVYLHGSVGRSPAELIVTDRDFGRAYLTESWATRFLLPMFDRRTVVFIGYSHEDTIMRYLALGLPSNTRRFAFTDDRDDDKWSHLDITPIGYTVRGEHDHGNLVDALTVWAQRAGMGALDHDSRVREILSSDPTALPPPERDYLISQLSTVDGARRFAAHAKELLWLRWAEDVAVFTGLFTGEPTSAPAQVLARWYAGFIEDPTTSDSALHTVRRLGRRLSDDLVYVASLATKALFDADPERGLRWRVFLMTSVDGKTAPGESGAALRFLRGGVSTTRAVVRSLLRPYLVFQPNWLDTEDSPHAPSADLDWPTPARDLHKIVMEHAEAATDDDLHSLALLEDALHSAYDLLAAYSSDREHPSFRFIRNQIDADPGHRVHHIDALVDGLRILGVRALPLRPDLPGRWWSSGRLLFRRLALHLVAMDPRLSPDERIAWVIERDAAYLGGMKHEVFRIFADNIAGATAAARGELLRAALAGPEPIEGLSDATRHVAYSRFNLLVWLTRHDPNWTEAVTEREAIRTANPRFAERDDPDLGSTMTTGTWGGVLPMPAEEFISRATDDGASAALAAVLERDYSEREFNQPTWDDALQLLGQVAAQDPISGLEVVDALEAVGEVTTRTAVQRAVIFGWSQAQIEETERDRVIAAVSEDAALTQSPHAVARFLLEQIRVAHESDAEAYADQLRELAIRLLSSALDQLADDGEHSADAPHVQGAWVNELTTYWVLEINRRWRSDEAGWGGLTSEESEQVRALLSHPSLAGDAAPVLAFHVYFLFSADESFAKATALPLFASAPLRIAAWEAYLTQPRLNILMLQEGMLDSLLAMWNNLSDLNEGVVRSFMSLAASILTSVGISDAQRRKLRFTSVTAEGARHAPTFAEVVVDRVEQGDDEDVSVWQVWVKDHIADRLTGFPRNARDNELAAWAAIVPLLGDDLPEGVRMFEGQEPGFHPDIPSLEIPTAAITNHREALVRHLCARIAKSPRDNPTVGYLLYGVVEALRAELSAAELAPLLAAARAQGYRFED